MSLNRLFCPHCETYVDVDITTVARSCVCPGCGKMIFLQFTSKESRQKRKALLMPTEQSQPVPPVRQAEPEELAPETMPVTQPPVYTQEETPVQAAASPVQRVPTQPLVNRPLVTPQTSPRVLSDNVVDRMVHDPEVRTNKRKFVIGLVSVLSLIVLTVLGNQFQWWSAISRNVETFSQKILVKGKVESRDDVVAETAKKAAEDNAKNNPVAPVASTTTTAKLSERDQAQAAVAAFLNAKDMSGRLEHVRDRALTEKMMSDYYRRAKDGPIAFEKVEEVEINPEGENTFSYIVTMATGEKRRMLVGKAGNGAYLVDWASFVLYGQLDWKTLMEKKPETPVLMRVLATSDSKYEGVFSDSGRFGCLKLTDPSQESAPPIYAYFTSSSTLGRSLNFIMRSSLDQAVPMTLMLKYPGNQTADNQVLIDEMVTQGWVSRGR